MEKQVIEAKAELAARRVTTAVGQVAPSIGDGQGSQRTTLRGVTSGSAPRKLFSEVVRSEEKERRFKLTVKTKTDLSSDNIRKEIKSKINPTDMRVGICSMKTLRDGRVLIETKSKEEIEKVNAAINEKCSQHLESNVSKLWNPHIIIYNVPEEVSLENAEEVILAQNPEISLKAGDIKPRHIFKNAKSRRNLIIEVGSEARKQILQAKLKIGWLICHAADYIKVTRCFKCSRF